VIAGLVVDAERGSATIWVVTAVLVVGFLAGAGVAVGSVAMAKERARTAADLSALAGAAVLVRDEGDPCARAHAIAVANGGLLSRCAVDGRDLRVWITVRLPGALTGFGLGNASARARAGPVVRAGLAPDMIKLDTPMPVCCSSHMSGFDGAASPYP
jgi:secretion/DNA translocation related TadE-like protein